MNIEKSHWYSEGNRVEFKVPFAKVDQERRIVSGFATLDNIDQQGDMVTPEAASDAFDRFRGNIREMHQPIAVGKLVSFTKEKYFDADSQQFYNGIYVNAYVSKGADSTWEKVLDGTLSGFSIGGTIKDAEKVYNKSIDATVQVIKSMDLYELSLVDNPANQLANIITVEKAANGDMKYSGMAMNVTLENVFYCENCRIATTSDQQSLFCPMCYCTMEMIGWVESNMDSPNMDNQDMIEMVNKHIAKVSGFQKSQENDPSEPNQAVKTDEIISKGGNSVGTKKEEAAVVEEVAVEKTVTPEEVVEEPEVVDAAVEEAAAEEPEVEVAVVEEAAEVVADAEEVVEKAVEEVESDESSIVKALEDFKTFVIEALTTQSAQTAATHQEALDAVSKSADEKISALKVELEGALAAITESINTVTKRVDSVESATAIKKSVDLGGSTVSKNNESAWGGRFLNVSSLVEE